MMYGIWNIATQRFLIGICEKNKGRSRGKVYCKIPDCLEAAGCSVQENHGINTLQQKGW